MIFALISIQLLSMARPSAAIGGWQTFNILLNRLSGERNQQMEQDKKSPPVVPNGGASGGSANKKEESGDGKESKKHNMGEVTMTSNETPGKVVAAGASTETSDPTFASQGRRGGMSLDENDVRTLAFVGRSNPFL